MTRNRDATTQAVRFMERIVALLPGRGVDVCDVFLARRRDAHADAQIRHRLVRIVATVEFADRLRIHVARLCAYEDAFFEVRLEDSLERYEERRPVVAVPVRMAARRNFGVVDLHVRGRVFREKVADLVEQHIANELLARRRVLAQSQLQILDGHRRHITGINRL